MEVFGEFPFGGVIGKNSVGLVGTYEISVDAFRRCLVLRSFTRQDQPRSPV